ncbi:hypothetical protein HK102_007161 [Quaeritorhiza haematococci]|nr:hypothetical protein HK102_007161 [Quaeritorhiza haematococci]
MSSANPRISDSDDTAATESEHALLTSTSNDNDTSSNTSSKASSKTPCSRPCSTRTSMFFLSIPLLTLTSLTLYYILFASASTSALTNLPPNTILTWRIPSFAYMNNQLVLTATCPIYNPTGLKLKHPGFWFPRIQGLSDELYIGFEDLVEAGEEYYVNEGLRREGRRERVVEVDRMGDIAKLDLEVELGEAGGEEDEKEKEYIVIRINDVGDAWWTHMFTRYNILGLILHDPRPPLVLASLRYKDPVGSLLRTVLAATNKNGQPRVASSIGLHVRTFDRSVSLQGGKECLNIKWFNPLKYFFKCAITAEDMISIIESVQTSPDQEIFLATDNVNHTSILAIKQHFKDRVFMSSDIIEYPTVSTGAVPAEAIPAILDSLVLAETDYFAGNFWSTFSGIVALRRGWRRYQFVGRVEGYLFCGGVLLLIVGGVAWCVGRRWRRKAQKGYAYELVA